MSPLRSYVCRVCGQGEERRETWDDPGPPRCPKCQATAYHRVLYAPTAIIRGSPLVNGERRFVRERVVQNPDGSETRYKSLQEARQGEYARVEGVAPNGLARTLLAKKNARTLASGMLPGRESTQLRQAMEEPRR